MYHEEIELSLLELPPPLLDSLLGYFCAPSLVKLGSTCKTFNNLARQESLWAHLLLTDFADSTFCYESSPAFGSSSSSACLLTDSRAKYSHKFARNCTNICRDVKPSTKANFFGTVVFVGPTKVGKSMLCSRLSGGSFKAEYHPTDQIDLVVALIKLNKMIFKLRVLDFSGHETYQ